MRVAGVRGRLNANIQSHGITRSKRFQAGPATAAREPEHHPLGLSSSARARQRLGSRTARTGDGHRCSTPELPGWHVVPKGAGGAHRSLEKGRASSKPLAHCQVVYVELVENHPDGTVSDHWGVARPDDEDMGVVPLLHSRRNISAVRGRANDSRLTPHTGSRSTVRSMGSTSQQSVAIRWLDRVAASVAC